MKKLLAVFSVLTLTACVNEQVFYDPQAAFESVECDETGFGGNVACTMPEKNTCSADGSDSVSSCKGNRTYSQLKVVFNNNQAYVFITGRVFQIGGWTYPHSARDMSGREMDFEVTDSTVGTICTPAVCQNLEHFNIYIDRNYIRSHLYNGIAIQIYGQRGRSMLVLPPAYVQRFDAFLRSQGL